MTENKYHVIPVESGAFESVTQVDIFADRGIRATVGNLGEATHIREYLFDTDKWSFSDAERWVAEHKKGSGLEKRSFDTTIGYSKEEHNTICLRGLAIPYNQISDNPIREMPNVKERILPGAFSESLASGRDVMMLWNHELKYIFGRTKRGTLQLHEDERGVSFVNFPPESGWAKDLLPSVKRGDYSNMSFSFKEDVKPDLTFENGKHVRNVRKATLYEISLVPYAVYETTSVGMRGSGHYVLDGMILPDPETEQKRTMDELDKFKEIEERFNQLKNQWIK